jgi:branched-chain amino acid transport system substrate-binding protein
MGRASSVSGRRLRSAGLVAALSGAALVLAACGGSASSESESASAGTAAAPSTAASGASAAPADGESIRVGVLAPMTGSVAADGEDIVRAATMVADEVNASGGIGGRPLELVVEDDACEAQQGVAAAEKLAASDVVAVVGGFCSSAALPASEVFNRSGGLPFLAAVSSNPKLTDAGYPGVTRYIGRDDQEAPVTAGYIADLIGSTKLAIMNDNTEFSRSTSDELRRQIEELGGVEIVYFDAIQPGEKDYRAALERVKNSGADTLIFTGFYPEFGTIASQWKRLDMPYRLLGGSSTIDASVIELAGDATTDERFGIITYPTAALLTSPEAEEYRTEYRERYGDDPGSYGVFEADALTGLVTALKEDPNDLSAAALATRLRALNFEGITGEISFDERGDRQAFPFLVVRSDDAGEFTPVATFAPSGGWESLTGATS